MIYDDAFRKSIAHKPSLLVHQWLNSPSKPFQTMVNELNTEYDAVMAVNATVATLEPRLKSFASLEVITSAVELHFWHMLEIHLGYAVENHPDIPHKTTHPEFLVQMPDQQVYVEVRTLTDDSEQTIGMRIFGNLQKKIKQTIPDAPLNITISPSGHFGGSFSVKRATAQIKVAVDEFIKTGGTKKKVNIVVDDVPITVYLDALPDETHPYVNFMPSSTFQVTPRRMVQAIKEKAAKYGTIGKPFVLVLDVPYSVRYDVDVLIRGMFGNEQITFDSASMTMTESGQRDGTGSFKPELNTRLSGVLYHSIEVSNGIEHAHHNALIHNPYASCPIPITMFPNIRQLMPVYDVNSNGHMKWLEPK